jgi:hypothetical protein
MIPMLQILISAPCCKVKGEDILVGKSEGKKSFGQT